MGKHDKHKDHKENDDLESDSTADEVSRIFKEHPKDYISRLEEIGFVYHDDWPDEEEQEEAEPNRKIKIRKTWSPSLMVTSLYLRK